MLGVGVYIRRFPDALQAEVALMNHHATKMKAVAQWDRRYAHMQFVLKWGPVFRRHVAALHKRQPIIYHNHLAA